MIPLIDLKPQHQAIRPDLEAALGRVLDSCRFILGEEVAAFEKAFARASGVSHAVAVNTGTSALHLALVVAGVGPGDEVITVPMTFVATVDAVRYTGARPVLVDVEPDTWTLDPSRAEAAITPRTRAIVPVHLHGLVADMDPIVDLARDRGIVVIEDASQAHGAAYKGRPAGSLGDLGCFSFYPSKNLGALGEAGAIVTDDEARAAALRMLRDCGRGPDRGHRIAGYNYRMDAFQGAVLNAKMAYFEGWSEARRGHAARYDAAVAKAGISGPPRPPGRSHAFHIYAVRSARRDRLQSALAAHGIETAVHYPIPVHLEEAYADLGYRAGDFPVSERLANELLSLPMFPTLTEGQIDTVCGALAESLATVQA